jgi:hypothetical protein
LKDLVKKGEIDMKKNLILMFAMFIVMTFGLQTASAQFTITIPKIPKIRKDKPKPDDSSTTTSDQTDNDQTTENTQTPQEKEPTLLSFYFGDINKAKESVDKYSPEEYLYLVNSVGGEWLLIAVSPKARQVWLKKDKEFADWSKSRPDNKVDAALAALAASGANKIPTYKPDPKNIAFHNSAEEKMMQSKLENFATLKIIKTGLTHSTWQIEKNDLGIPTDRYKWGIVWARDTSDDHPYCHIYHVNVIQDYAGGGTYGATYANFVSDELAGCQ